MPIPLRQMIGVGAYVAKQHLLGRKRYPLVLMLEPLFRCNLACAGCGKIDYPAEILNQRISVKDALAAAEEMLFRGALLQGLAVEGGWPLPAALAAAALAFGALHRLPGRELRAFTVWSVWEGALLGAVYVGTGSLAAAMLCHAAHDALGFAAFRVGIEHREEDLSVAPTIGEGDTHDEDTYDPMQREGIDPELEPEDVE